MKVLILSCNTGEGHNSSAKALKVSMDKQRIDSEIVDVLSFAGRKISRRVSQIYNYSIKGTLFRNLYRIGELVSNHLKGLKSPVYYANRIYAFELYRFILKNGYDAVVAVHLFAAEALTAIKRNQKFDIPAFFVMTDYTCIPFLGETELDEYAIAHEDLLNEFVEAGIPREKITATGIPVNGTNMHINKTESRDIMISYLNLDAEQKDGNWFLIMGGSMGYGNMEKLVGTLCKKTAVTDCIICICGRNKESQRNITELFSGNTQVKVIGFTDKIPLLMNSADVLFSKPGGITSTEALLYNVPLVHTDPIPGFEYRNALFFHNRNMSYYTKDVEKQVSVAKRLCNDNTYRANMLNAQRINANTESCNIIIDHIIRMSKQHAAAN